MMYDKVKSMKGISMPKYQKIYQELRSQIKEGEIALNDQLPSEQDLMDHFQVSRDTVRKALNILKDEGYIETRRGTPARVIAQKPLNFPVTEITSFQEINLLDGLEAVTIVEDYELIHDPKLTKKLFGANKDEALYRVVRTREIDGERVILDIDYFRQSIIGSLPFRACKDSIYKYLEEERGFEIAYAMKEFTAETPDHLVSQHLDLLHYNVVVVVRSHTYLSDNTIFQYTESFHRPDRFKFVDIAQRRLN